jgi:phosphoribosyl 1,2-cyclic phosphate phosphodiesterase
MPGSRMLVDTSTDLRHQLLAAGIDSVDAVFWTHDHADHCHGIDDLRPMRFGRDGPLPGLPRPKTVRRLRQRFGYVFRRAARLSDDRHLDNARPGAALRRLRIGHVQMPHGPASPPDTGSSVTVNQ